MRRLYCGACTAIDVQLSIQDRAAVCDKVIRDKLAFRSIAFGYDLILIAARMTGIYSLKVKVHKCI